MMTSSSSSSSIPTPTQRYAAGALFGLALHQAQNHQTRNFGVPPDDPDEAPGVTQDRISGASSSSDSVSEDPNAWVHDSFDLLRPVFRFLDIEENAWTGLEETSGCLPANHHVGAFLRLLAEENAEASSEIVEKELAFSKGIDAMAASIEISPDDRELRKEKQNEFEYQCREKLSSGDDTPAEKLHSQAENVEISAKTAKIEQNNEQVSDKYEEKPVEEVALLGYSRKVTVLYEILSACLAAGSEVDKKAKKRRKGYDSRHRMALRLLTTWLDVKWIKVEASEIMVACSAMALLKEEESNEGKQSKESSWAKWKRGGIIGAAALTGGTLLAITGGLAAPAIAAGFGALAPTLGTIIPVIGAGGFAAIASAAGSVAGSVAVAASFGAAGAGLTGSKMARRIGDVEEFEFKTLGENHNQGRLAVEILIAGFVFTEGDFIKSWEGVHDNSERYALQWETKNLIALSTAIQDWLTSKIARELITRGAMMTVLHGLLTAFAWPTALLSATSFIDSIWTIAVDRCDKAGKILAEVLMNGLQGNRPVTLVGFSLGARLIFKCLQVLSENENCGGLVERVVLMGAPVAIKDENWEAVRKVVAGRFVNTYSTNDWMLAVAFRASLLTQGLAGIQPVEVPGIENVDVTELIDGHSSYLWASPQILEQLELDTPYPVFNGAVVVK